METKIIATDNFQKEVRKLQKKYKSLLSELDEFEKELLENPLKGTSIGRNNYKIRLAVKSKGKGKRGGLRIITHLDIEILKDKKSSTLYLLTIYDKSKTENISQKDINRLVETIKP